MGSRGENTKTMSEEKDNSFNFHQAESKDTLIAECCASKIYLRVKFPRNISPKTLLKYNPNMTMRENDKNPEKPIGFPAEK